MINSNSDYSCIALDMYQSRNYKLPRFNIQRSKLNFKALALTFSFEFHVSLKLCVSASISSQTFLLINKSLLSLIFVQRQLLSFILIERTFYRYFVIDERFQKMTNKRARKRMFVLKLSISKLSSFIRNLFRISINVRERCIYLMEAFIRIFLENIVRK